MDGSNGPGLKGIRIETDVLKHTFEGDDSDEIFTT